jgi:hypothetical protein
MKTTITPTKHTKKGFDLWVVALDVRVTKARYLAILAVAKKLGGWYSSYKKEGAIPGFQFKDKESAEQFARVMEGTPAKVEITDDELLAVLA